MIHITDNDLAPSGFGRVEFQVANMGGTFHLDAGSLRSGRFELLHGSSGIVFGAGVNPQPGSFIGKFRALNTESAKLTAGEAQRIAIAAYQAARAERQRTVA